MARLFLVGVLSLLAAAPAAASVAYTQAALDDEVTALPGLNYPIKFRHFSGYLNVGGGAGGVNATEGEGARMMHYQFFEAEDSPESSPVVLWTNGGPGCSGLLGLYTEQGPFRPDAEGVLSENPYRWNRVANMLFIEAPVGVGFSYAEDPADYKIGDIKTAQDNYRLIVQFLERFPAFKDNDFIISSESYGGHYMPTLATEIVLQQERNPEPKINFRGFLVGNPFTSWTNNKVATYDTFWGHQLVAFPSYMKWKKACAHLRSPQQYLNSDCPRLERIMDREIGDLNPYALDWPVCVAEDDAAQPAKRGRAQRTWLLHHTHRASQSELGADGEQGLGIIDIDDYEPCEDNYLTVYLNRPEVKEALHVKGDIEWVECSTTTRYNVQDLLIPMEPLYHLLAGERYGLDILVYSGDDDSVCGLSGTQEWMHGLGFDVATRWAPWKDAEGQPAGFVTQWRNNVTLATVHGGGHEVPTYTPEVALQLFQWYLDRTWFDLSAFRATDDDEPEAATTAEAL